VRVGTWRAQPLSAQGTWQGSRDSGLSSGHHPRPSPSRSGTWVRWPRFTAPPAHALAGRTARQSGWHSRIAGLAARPEVRRKPGAAQPLGQRKEGWRASPLAWHGSRRRPTRAKGQPQQGSRCCILAGRRLWVSTRQVRVRVLVRRRHPPRCLADDLQWSGQRKLRDLVRYPPSGRRRACDATGPSHHAATY